MTYEATPAGRSVALRLHPISMDKFSCKFSGVDVSFDSMDVRKMSFGGIALGGVNVLEMRNLRLTLRNAASSGKHPESASSGGLALAPDAAAADQISTLRSMFVPNLNVSAIRIDGLQVYRKGESGEAAIWLSAEQLRNSGKQLRLKNLVVHEPNGERMLGEARLDMNTGYFIEYGEDFSERMRIL